MENELLLVLPLVRTVQTRPLESLILHFASQHVVLNELSHMIDNQWKARSLFYVCLMRVPMLKCHKNKRAYPSKRDTSPELKTHLKITKTLKVR